MYICVCVCVCVFVFVCVCVCVLYVFGYPTVKIIDTCICLVKSQRFASFVPFNVTEMV